MNEELHPTMEGPDQVVLKKAAAVVKAFLEQEYPRPDVPLTDTTNLLEDWFVDSMEVVQIVIFLETRFRVDIHRADITGANFRDIAAITAFVAERLGQ